MTVSVLVYGDSLTWGRDPETGARHPERHRWPCVLQQELGPEVRIQAEGLRGRSTIFDDLSAGFDKNGARHLPTVLATHQPFDIAVIMLGTNDLKPGLAETAAGAVVGLRRLVTILRTFPYDPGNPVPEILLVNPPHLRRTSSGAPPARGRSLAESRALGPAIAALCRETGCTFVDASEVALASPVDGVHLDGPNTRRIGLLVARHLRERLSRG